MHSFHYLKAKTPRQAAESYHGRAKLLAGGTTLIDLMKLEVETPETLIDINHLPWNKIEAEPGGGFRIGALVSNSGLAEHEGIKLHYTALSEALLSGASTQLRNMATTGGNLLQRTRCVYFRDPTKNCNKREPGSGCDAIGGFNRNLAVLGTSEHCIATNPSDMNVALAAFEAKVHLLSGAKERTVALADFHLVPGATPQVETVLQDREIITGVSLPRLLPKTASVYLKLRDRSSYEFALASAAVVLNMEGGQVSRARIAMGGVATKPWRVPSAEQLLEGAAPSDELFNAVAIEFMREAKGYSDNSFKIELARRCLVRGLKLAAARIGARGAV